MATSAQAAQITGKADIVDGDTIKILGLSLRLSAIDAPEALQQCKDKSGSPWNCGRASTRALAGLLNQGEVTCSGDKKDAYKRLLVFCTVNGINVNQWMVSKGWAFAFIKYDKRYQGQQIRAESKRVGIWRGTVQKPWEWRRGKLTEASTGKQGDCLIKGNINRRKERIYHMPFHQFYGRTRINEAKGERWFCTENEALKAGWRRALR